MTKKFAALLGFTCVVTFALVLSAAEKASIARDNDGATTREVIVTIENLDTDISLLGQGSVTTVDSCNACISTLDCSDPANENALCNECGSDEIECYCHFCDGAWRCTDPFPCG